MTYEAVRGTIADDDALKQQGMEIRFRARETPIGSARTELETEMLRRGMMFDVIEWSEDQAKLPFRGCWLSRARARASIS